MRPEQTAVQAGAALLFSLIIIVVSYLAITKASKDANDVVAVLRVKPSEGIPAFAQLNDNLIEKYSIIRKEYTDDMVLAEDLDEVKGKLTANFLRKTQCSTRTS